MKKSYLAYTLGDNRAAVSGNTPLKHFLCYVQVHSSAHLDSVVKLIILFLATKRACYLVERKEGKNNIDRFA